MYQNLSKKSLSWIKSNLMTFLKLAKISYKLGFVYKVSAELLFTFIFKNHNDELDSEISFKLKNIQKKKPIFNSISQKDFGKIILMIFFNKEQNFTKTALDSVNLLSYREQLEFSMYLSLLNNSSSIKLPDDKILENTLIHQKLSVCNFEIMDIYELTHEIMYLTMLGRSKHQILSDNLEYLRAVTHSLLDRMITEKNIDLIAELILVSQLLNIELDGKIKDNSYVLLDAFLEQNINKCGISIILNKQFNKIYHQMLVISLLR